MMIFSGKQGDIHVAPRGDQEAYVPKTDLGRRLLALREDAIKDGMRLMTEDEIRQEIRERRCEGEELAQSVCQPRQSDPDHIAASGKMIPCECATPGCTCHHYGLPPGQQEVTP